MLICGIFVSMIYEMIIKGYRIYRYKGIGYKHLFLEMVKLEEYPNLIFIKNKKVAQ